MAPRTRRSQMRGLTDHTNGAQNENLPPFQTPTHTTVGNTVGANHTAATRIDVALPSKPIFV
jgi:hypothetical protein